MIIDTCGTEKKTRTNKEGEFEFSKIDDQTYTLRASKEDFFTNTMDVTITPPDVVQINEEQTLLENIEYEFNSAILDERAQFQMKKIAAVMKSKPHYKIELRSYTDARGSNEYNLALSKKRATSVKNYLIFQGIPSKNIISRGYGETNLIVKNATTNAQHQLNRRTEFSWIVSKPTP